MNNIDIDKFCDEINRCMAWMKTGVAICVGISITAFLLVIFLLVMK